MKKIAAAITHTKPIIDQEEAESLVVIKEENETTQNDAPSYENKTAGTKLRK